MPLNALQIVDQFRMKSQADRRAEQMNEVATQLKMDETMRGVRNRNVLGELAKANPNDPRAVADQYIAQTGDAETGFRLQDRANQADDRREQNELRKVDAHLKGLDWISKTGRMVTKDNYGAWKQSAEQLGITAAGELPDEYDQDIMDRLTGAADAELKEVKINLPGRMQQQIFSRGGKEVYRSEPYERDAPKNAPETWSAPFEKDGITYQQSSRGKLNTVGRPGSEPETWGDPYVQDGQTVQRSSRGRIQPVGGRGAQSGDLGIMDRLISSGIAKDDREAWNMLQGYKKNPTAGAQQIARMEVQAQKDAGIMPGDADYRSPAQIYQEVRQQMAEFDGMPGDGDAAPLERPAADEPKPAAPPKKPKIGIVEDGYRFMGGDPADPKNWKPVK